MSDASSARLLSPESEFVTAINNYRNQAGVQPLRVDATMAAAADAWSVHMVERSYIGHADLTEILALAPADQSKAGENVGRGATVESLLAAFMQSPAHRANILDPAFTHIGVGVQVHPSSRKLYTTHRFASVPETVNAPVPLAIAPPAPQPTEPPAATPPPTTSATETPVPTVQPAEPTPAPTPSPVPTVQPAEQPVTLEPGSPRGSRRLDGSTTVTQTSPLDRAHAKTSRGSRSFID